MIIKFNRYISEGDTTLEAGRSRVGFPMGPLGFMNDLILPAALWPWVLLRL